MGYFVQSQPEPEALLCFCLLCLVMSRMTGTADYNKWFAGATYGLVIFSMLGKMWSGSRKIFTLPDMIVLLLGGHITFIYSIDPWKCFRLVFRLVVRPVFQCHSLSISQRHNQSLCLLSTLSLTVCCVILMILGHNVTILRLTRWFTRSDISTQGQMPGKVPSWFIQSSFILSFLSHLEKHFSRKTLSLKNGGGFPTGFYGSLSLIMRQIKRDRFFLAKTNKFQRLK